MAVVALLSSMKELAASSWLTSVWVVSCGTLTVLAELQRALLEREATS